MDTTLNKGMVALPIEDYDRFKELEKKDYNFEKRVSEERDRYNRKLEAFKDKKLVYFRESYDKHLYNMSYYLNPKNPNTKKRIMDKIGFESIMINNNGVRIDGICYFKTDSLFLSLDRRTDELRKEIKDLKERRYKILSSLSLFSLIKSWWNLKK